MKCDPATRKFTSSMTGEACEEVAAGQYLLDVVSGLRYLHIHHIAHRDLKPDNVLLGVNGHCKIADFGVSHHFTEDAHKEAASMRSLERSTSRAQIKETQGTYSFWAPEMLDGAESFNAYGCDLWATGVCYYIFVTGELPFWADDVTKLRAAGAGGERARPRYKNRRQIRILPRVGSTSSARRSTRCPTRSTTTANG